MGEIILSQVGAAAGSALLPNGLALGPLSVSGAALGLIAGSYLGQAIDASLAKTLDGPRIDTLHAMGAAEGAGMARVYGRARVGGQLIWASRFREKRREQSAGKGGPRFSSYAYSISLAVAVCDGPVTRLDKVWANGEVLALSNFNWRFYDGGEDQLPDPAIEAIEGAGQAPAFRGTAYIVLEDLPLEMFGNRIPQFSFEVVRAGSAFEGLRAGVKGVNIIPATGEFVYGTQIVRERSFPGVERPLNMNNAHGDADFSRSLDQLVADAPQLDAATLTVAWFGDDLRVGHCKVRPGVESLTRITVPYEWRVAGQTRGSAYLVSQTDGAANYGGTPADTAVLEGIAAMKAAGIAVTLSPFLLMDVAPGNGLPDPYGENEQAAFPWRGRMTHAEDGTASVRVAIEAFLGSDNDFGYRHFILHHARLADQAGGVEAFLIGSEMRGLTRLRDETGAFPFVEGLLQLAADVKAIVGPGVNVSYAADWTEYGAYVPSDSSGDVLFPLDPLWASPNIDFVGVDWYPPVGDWRDGDQHVDALAGYDAADDADYLSSQMAGGEAFDWFYADVAARDAQIRTPIVDSAHGEHWVFRQKDLAGWWASLHHERPSGVRNSAATAWQPGMKPVRLVEVGFPAVDKGGNAPNLFYDPKSAESALPPHSTGERDDVYQRRALEAALSYWQAQPFVDKAYIWAWDGRPWPDFPTRQTVWNDGPNWNYGHWLNGRMGLISVGEVAEDLCAGAGLTVDVRDVDGLIEGYATHGPAPLRRLLEPLKTAYGLMINEADDGLAFSSAGRHAIVSVPQSRLLDPGLSLTRPLLDKQPGRLQLSFVSAEGSYAPATAEARSDEGDPRLTVELQLPLILSDAAASALAGDLLASINEPETASLSLPPEWVDLEPGDGVLVEGSPGEWQVADIVDDGLARQVSLSRPWSAPAKRSLSIPSEQVPPARRAMPELVLIDGPELASSDFIGPIVAVAASPWGGPVDISAGPSSAGLRVRQTVSEPAGIGQLVEVASGGPFGRWDEATTITVDMHHAELMGRSAEDTLGGLNRLLLQGEAGWELIGYRNAELIGADRWQLSGLLRGLSGTLIQQHRAGTICVHVDDRLQPAPLQTDEGGRALLWSAGESEMQQFTFNHEAGLGWSVAHLTARKVTGGTRVSWLPRGRTIPDSWELPDPPVQRYFKLEALREGQVELMETVSGTQFLLTGTYDVARVAELGTDGREGRWVSIPIGAS